LVRSLFLMMHDGPHHFMGPGHSFGSENDARARFMWLKERDDGTASEIGKEDVTIYVLKVGEPLQVIEQHAYTKKPPVPLSPR